MKSLTKKKTKVWLATTLSVLLTAVLVLSGVGIYFKLKPKGKAPLEVNPLDFSIDAWDGSSVDALNFNGDYAGRGTRTKTIDSAASFVHFVSEVNKGETFETYTIYLNKNIDLAGHTINSIGDAEHPFKGKFDGGHYTIFNANINGNGLFGVVDGAEIKNVGLYNCIINSTGSAGGLIGKAINTDVINSFVRLGSINGSEIGGLIGEYVSNNGEHTISNSFVDVEKDNVNSLIHTLNTNDSQENELTIKYSYLVGSEVKSVANKVSGAYVDDETFINPTKLSDFDKNEWKYDSKYETKETNWCDYDYLNGSDELEFNYPVQKGFVKVFLTGSGYENVVVINGEAENATNLAEAFTKADETVSMGSNKEAEINLLVDKIFMEAKAEVESSNITINAVKNTTIVRGENNEESMFVSSGTSKIVIGGENVNARTNTTATLTLDGNRDYIKENNLESGALIVSNGKGVEIKENVILKNNVNNNIGYGGAVLVCNPTEDVNIDADIKNCSAENGGGVAIIGASGAELKADFSNCSSINGGGAIYISCSIPWNRAGMYTTFIVTMIIPVLTAAVLSLINCWKTPRHISLTSSCARLNPASPVSWSWWKSTSMASSLFGASGLSAFWIMPIPPMQATRNPDRSMALSTNGTWRICRATSVAFLPTAVRTDITSAPLPSTVIKRIRM